MKIQTPQKPCTPCTRPNKGPEPPQNPKPSFADEFVSNLDRSAAAVNSVLYPVSFCLAGSRIGGRLGYAVAGQGGALAGSLGMSYLGSVVGGNVNRSLNEMVAPAGDKTRAGVRTGYALALGAFTAASAVGSFGLGPVAVGAGAVAVGLGGYSLLKSL